MKTFFLVDDDSDDRMVFREALDSLNLPVHYQEATNGQEALERIADPAFKIPDIIFLDLNMPKVNGYEVLTNVKRIPRYEKIPIFIYTTSSNAFEKERCIQAGAAGFMTKHDSFEDLCQELLRIVASL